ncbi:MAG: 1-acyl-sn-glycerol-3-phosphate acyltransferase [Aureispira sp.]
MLYYLFRFFLWIMFVCFYRRVYYLNSKHIPRKGTSVIFVSNHSNGFMDPILVAALQSRPVYFWVGAGEIPGNFIGKLMDKLHSIPIYRAKEGRDKMHKNKETFRITKDYLYTGWSSMWIAPEGRCNVQKRLEPIKKGTARLAFEMMEEKDWALDLQILPTGVNYTNHVQFRSEVYVDLGEPLKVSDYKEQFLENKETAIAQLTQDIEQGIRQKMVYIEEENTALTEAFLPLVRHNFKRPLWPLYSTDRHLCSGEQQVAKQIEQAEASEKTTWATQLNAYEAALLEEGVSDFAVAHKNKRSLLVLLLGFPFWLLGTLSGWIPHFIASKLRNKFVPFPAFSTSFAFTAAFFVWILWAIIMTSAGAFIVGWWSLLWPTIMVLLQTFAYHYTDYAKEWGALFRFNKKKKTIKEALQTQRRALPLIGV